MEDENKGALVAEAAGRSDGGSSKPTANSTGPLRGGGGSSVGGLHPVVVGIGASAGGMTALKTLFELIPPDSGVAFVVVVHLSPEHKSELAQLLQRNSAIPVQQVTEVVALEANTIYVIPPGQNLSAIDSHLHIEPLEEQRSKRTPIDHFFRTLAASHEGNSVGVVLTGTGSDGSLGIQEIKGRGGLTVAQEPMRRSMTACHAARWRPAR